MKKLLIAASFLAIFMTGCQQNCNSACPEAPSDPVAPAPDAAPKAEDAATDVQPANTPIEAGGEEIVLPMPIPSKATLTESLSNRRSVRAYTDQTVSLEQLSALLWSACGVNREDGKRTAPSAMNKQSVSLYVAFEKGAYKYDHANHKLVRVSADDLRPVKLAPAEIIFTSNHENELIRGIDAGTVSQNAALYCAAEGLATVIRMMRGDQSEIQKGLGLGETELPLFNMAVGFEKK